MRARRRSGESSNGRTDRRRIGRAGRSETHHRLARRAMGFAIALPIRARIAKRRQPLLFDVCRATENDRELPSESRICAAATGLPDTSANQLPWRAGRRTGTTGSILSRTRPRGRSPGPSTTSVRASIGKRCGHRRSKRSPGAVRATRALSHALLAFSASSPPEVAPVHMPAPDSAPAGLARQPYPGYRPTDLVVRRLNFLSLPLSLL